MELLEDLVFHRKYKISELINEYDAFFFDIWGVLHEGGELYPGIASMMNNLLNHNKTVRLISNVPRLKNNTARYLKDKGLDIDENHIFTSGEHTRLMLRNSEKYFSKKIENIYHIGQDRNDEILSDLGLNIVSHPADSDIILITAYRDIDENHDDLIKILELAYAYNKHAICANPDTEVIHQGNIRYCAGYFANLFEKLGGEVIYVGKPDNLIFEHCKESFPAENARILMIGDTFVTDVKGANGAGIDSALVLTGNTKVLMNKSGIKEEILAINKVCSSQSFLPKYLIELC